jgi:uncharacterized membrane protein YjjB (DUF3815 family)
MTPSPQEAKVHNRLGSDTYKRLALGLLYAAVLALVVNLRFIAMLGAALVGCVGGMVAQLLMPVQRVLAAWKGSHCCGREVDRMMKEGREP